MLAAALGCGSPKTFDSLTVEQPTTVTDARAGVNPTFTRRPLRSPPSPSDVKLWNETVVWNTIVDAAAAERAEHQRTSSSNRTAAATELPPDAVCQRESHCTYGINTGNGYYGKWQFDLGWGGHFGLPADITTWTPAQEDYAAAQLWDHGRGCSHWNEC